MAVSICRAVLAEEVKPVEDIDATMIAPAIKDAKEDLADAAGHISRDRAKTRLEQLKTLEGH